MNNNDLHQTIGQAKRKKTLDRKAVRHIAGVTAVLCVPIVALYFMIPALAIAGAAVWLTTVFSLWVMGALNQ